MRGVNSLIAELDRRLPQSLPRIPQILGKAACQVFLGCGPAIVRRPFLDLLLAVITLSCRHQVVIPYRLSFLRRLFRAAANANGDPDSGRFRAGVFADVTESAGSTLL